MCVVRNCSRGLFKDGYCKTHHPETQREYRRNNPEKFRHYNMKRYYGIGEDEFQAILDDQGGVCAICGKLNLVERSNTGDVKHLAVDHDHADGVVRGLLCQNCNLGIGSFFDQPLLLRKAAEYLEAHAQSKVNAQNLADEIVRELTG